MNDRGFSLVEALVALVILAMGVSTALAVVSANQQRLAVSSARLRSVLVAESILDRVGLDVPLRTGRSSGTLADGSRWTIEIGLAEAPANARVNAPSLHTVTVGVTPRDTRIPPIELKTLRFDGAPL